MLTSTIEIAASPEEVRKVFLDFEKYSEWHKGMFKSITPLSEINSLDVGQKVHCKVDDLKFDAVITKNSPVEFQWQGDPVMGIAGLHTFSFEPSRETEGGTTFVQKEEFTGTVAFLMQSWLLGRGLLKGFGVFGGDLKKRAEG